VIEAVVMAVVGDDFTLGASARRWLDDDEFLVRRRIHRDLRATMAQTS
jgi:cellulose synthase operon protein C